MFNQGFIYIHWCKVASALDKHFQELYNFILLFLEIVGLTVGLGLNLGNGSEKLDKYVVSRELVYLHM